MFFEKITLPKMETTTTNKKKIYIYIYIYSKMLPVMSPFGPCCWFFPNFSICKTMEILTAWGTTHGKPPNLGSKVDLSETTTQSGCRIIHLKIGHDPKKYYIYINTYIYIWQNTCQNMMSSQVLKFEDRFMFMFSSFNLWKTNGSGPTNHDEIKTTSHSH